MPALWVCLAGVVGAVLADRGGIVFKTWLGLAALNKRICRAGRYSADDV
jgi:hypothetical protein